jgi:2'-5' RNA ligase
LKKSIKKDNIKYMRLRVFVAINLPEQIKNELLKYQKKWPDLPARWTKKENLHITLIFLGYLNNQELLEVLRITKEVASRHQPFFINLTKIIYAPPKKMPPRMVWVEGEKSNELEKLQKDLKNSLTFPISSNKEEIGEKETFTPHITLARIRQWDFRKIEPEERPLIEEEISLNFQVNSIEVMESQLKRGGPEYTVLETCPLSKNF